MVTSIRINAGGGAIGIYGADAHGSGGQTASSNAPVDGKGVYYPANQEVYQTERYGTFTYTFIDVLIANGSYDSYLNDWADTMKSFQAGPGVYGDADDRRVYLRFAHEAIPEWGTTSDNYGSNNVGAKGQWIVEMFDYLSVKPQIKMLCYFNIDKETDWAIFGGGRGDSTYTAGATVHQVYSVYKARVSADYVIPGNNSPQRITDAQFKGL